MVCVGVSSRNARAGWPGRFSKLSAAAGALKAAGGVRRAVLIPLCLLTAPVPCTALIWRSLTGYADVTAVQSEVDGVEQRTLRQEYAARWSKELAPYVTFRSSLRYFNFNLDQEPAPSAWREEIQPAGELTWRHPAFVLSTSAQRRDAKARTSINNLITDDISASIRSRDPGYPLLAVRYDWRHYFDSVTGDDRDTRDRRLQASADYFRGSQTFSYSFTRRATDNVITGIESAATDHVFRWSGVASALREARLRLSGNYTFTRSSETNESIGADEILERVPIVAGLYADDTSPEFGELAAVPGLVDGNTDSPTSPAIDIGGELRDRNVGADLGFRRPVGVLYVYTDRASGTQERWQIYTSGDNLSWELVNAARIVRFNAALSRYEIDVGGTEARYVKAVDVGVNEVDEVYVTEIEVLQSLGTTVEQTRTRHAHLAGARASYPLSETADLALDLSYQHDPGRGLVGTRDLADYAMSLSYADTDQTSHQLRWEQAFQFFTGSAGDLLENSLLYSFRYEPLRTLNALISLNSRHGFLGGEKEREINNFLAQVNGRPLPELTATVQRARTRSHQFLVGGRSDAWNTRVSMDANLTRRLSAVVTYGRQSVTTKSEDRARLRHHYGVAVDFRLTPSILLRGDVSLIEDERESRTQDYLVSWNVTPKLTLGAQAFLNRATGDAETERYAANLNFALTRRTTFYANVSRIDFTEVGGGETISFQQGLRTGF